MPFVDLKIIKGRTMEQKRNLVDSVTKAVSSAIDVPSERIHVHIIEMEADSIAVNGQFISDQKK